MEKFKIITLAIVIILIGDAIVYGTVPDEERIKLKWKRYLPLSGWWLFFKFYFR